MQRIVFFLCLLLLFSCRKKDDLTADTTVPQDKAPEVTERYYFQAKADSSWKTLQYSSTPVYESLEGITFSFFTGQTGSDHYEVNINLSDSFPTAELINDLEGKRIYFDSAGSRVPEIRLIQNDILYSSSFLNQNGSSMIVYDVSSDGTSGGKNCWLLRGFFSCRIATVSGLEIHSLTSGKFAIRVKEK